MRMDKRKAAELSFFIGVIFMEVKELISKSPIRIFEKNINGGLGRGNLGVLTSRRGVGKTACLVHLAIDKIMNGQNIIHVSFGSNMEHIMNWYKEVFNELTPKKMDDRNEVYDKVHSNRVMLNFSQENVSVDNIINSLETLISQGAFKADAVFFDGYKLTVASEDDIRKIKAFAQKMNVEVWFCVSPVRMDISYDEYGIAETLNPYKDMIDVLVGLHYNDEKSRVILTVIKDHKTEIAHPAGVSLDPKTMLIAG